MISSDAKLSLIACNQCELEICDEGDIRCRFTQLKRQAKGLQPMMISNTAHKRSEDIKAGVIACLVKLQLEKGKSING